MKSGLDALLEKLEEFVNQLDEKADEEDEDCEECCGGTSEKDRGALLLKIYRAFDRWEKFIDSLSGIKGSAIQESSAFHDMKFATTYLMFKEIKNAMNRLEEE